MDPNARPAKPRTLLAALTLPMSCSGTSRWRKESEQTFQITACMMYNASMRPASNAVVLIASMPRLSDPRARLPSIELR